MLSVKNLDSFYGKAQVLHGVSFEIPTGKVVALLGPNGAGKSTTMMSISGMVKLSSASSILYDDVELNGMKPEKIVRHGVIHVPQGRGVFPGLTIRENLIMGAYLKKSKKQIELDIESVMEFFPKFKDRIRQLAGTLSGGEQQMLAIMRGIMASPSMLMLDEPSMGLAPIIVEQVYNSIAQIAKSGITIFLVEQNTNMALNVADYTYILSSGKIVSSGNTEFFRSQGDLLKSYFKGHDET